MSWYDYDDYESKARAASRVEKELVKRRKRGEQLAPVLPGGRGKEMSTTFWGQAWNRNLIAYSDYESRMPRGRTYFRGGKVLGMEISPGLVESTVAGSYLYEVSIQISPLRKNAWKSLKQRCQGKIVGLVELLSGELSNEVMKIVTDLDEGLFPSSREIKLSCSCPDHAGMCKHCAATLYAVGTLLDDNPRHLFTLRGVDPAELSGNATSTIASLTAPVNQAADRAAALEGSELSDLFGIDLGDLSSLVVPMEVSKPKAAAKKGSAKRK